jgi:hypothetical protein
MQEHLARLHSPRSDQGSLEDSVVSRVLHQVSTLVHTPKYTTYGLEDRQNCYHPQSQAPGYHQKNGGAIKIESSLTETFSTKHATYPS